MRFLAPRWLALHVVVLAAGVTMVLLGRWQWHVAHVRHGDIQNYAYAFQWWAFTGFALAMWVRVMRDATRGRDMLDRRSMPFPHCGGWLGCPDKGIARLNCDDQLSRWYLEKE